MPDDDSGDELAAEVVQSQAPIVPYSLSDITRDGCFMSEPELEQLDRLRTKKNLILQGPPGTGKTWLAKRLAFALMGRRTKARSEPSSSTESFVRGLRARLAAYW
jgi:5-methylcytosine-specific restriction protein B